MVNKDIAVDNLNRLRGSGIHDARVFELHYLESSYLRVRLRNAVSDRTIVLDGVEMFGCRDFINGTIVSDIFVWDVSNIAARTNQEGWRTLFGGNFSDQDLDKIIDEAVERYTSYLFVSIESSYGGRIAAICRSIC